MFGHPLQIIGLALLMLLVFGPKRMIDMASSLGKTFRELRDSTKDVNWSNLLNSDEHLPSSPLSQLSQLTQTLHNATTPAPAAPPAAAPAAPVVPAVEATHAPTIVVDTSVELPRE